jgi:tyrosine-protein kinase Etk/Wzc
VLRRRIWLVLGTTSAVVLVTWVVLAQQVPQYRASALLRLQDQRGSLTGPIASASAEGLTGRGTDPILSQLQVIRSQVVAGAVVDSTGLRIRSLTPDFSAGVLRAVRVQEPGATDTLNVRFTSEGVEVRATRDSATGAYGEPLHVGELEFIVPSRPGVDEARLVVLTRQQAIEAYWQRLQTSVRDRTDAVDVSYTASDPEWAQRVVNATAQAFQAASVHTAQDQARRRRIFLEEQLMQTDSALTRAQLELTNFQRREGVASSQEKLSAQQVGLMQLDARREELDADRRVLRSLLTALSRQKQPGQRLGSLMSTPSVAQNPAVTGLFSQLLRQEAALDSLTTGEWASAPTNPDVQRLRQLVEGTRARLVEAVASQADALDARLGALDALRARNLVELQAMPESGAEEVRLLQRVQGIGRIVELLREEHQKARIAEAVEAGQVEVVDLAALPVSPMASGRALKLGLALALGLMLGSGSALLFEHMNTAINRRDELEGLLHLPGLAVIPQIAPQVRAGGLGRLKLPALSRATVPGDDRRGSLVTASMLRTAGAEAYRTLRTNLIFSQAVQSLHRIVVTSSDPGEGKTTTAANLAVTFAQQGVRVLLVDCDFRRPQLHNVFGTPREPGLTQLLLGQGEAEQLVRSTPVEGLALLTAGALPPNPSELLGGARMQEVLAALGESFDLVILDTPPLLAAADAAILGRQSDGVLLVVRAGKTDRAAAQQALQQLHTVGARVVGAVLNDPDAKVAAYGGYFAYDYYGSEEQPA